MADVVCRRCRVSVPRRQGRRVGRVDTADGTGEDGVPAGRADPQPGEAGESNVADAHASHRDRGSAAGCCGVRRLRASDPSVCGVAGYAVVVGDGGWRAGLLVHGGEVLGHPPVHATTGRGGRGGGLLGRLLPCRAGRFAGPVRTHLGGLDPGGRRRGGPAGVGLCGRFGGRLCRCRALGAPRRRSAGPRRSGRGGCDGVVD
jgi:hypothetical protein